jgi:hypothetical protein
VVIWFASCENCIHGMHFKEFNRVNEWPPILEFWECLAPADLSFLAKILRSWEPNYYEKKASCCGLYKKIKEEEHQ